jgi:hypothetical protein
MIARIPTDVQRRTRAPRTRGRARTAAVPHEGAQAVPRAHTGPHGALVRDIASLLAAGFVRAVLSGGYPVSPNPLALCADHEPSCQANADTRQRTPRPARDGDLP